jgi:hypothetical protein
LWVVAVAVEPTVETAVAVVNFALDLRRVHGYRLQEQNLHFK